MILQLWEPSLKKILFIVCFGFFPNFTPDIFNKIYESNKEIDW